MTTKDIRKKFLEFFASKKHSIVASDSLVPKDDPTVLFTTAGMQQFKKQFLGQIDEFTCAATSQKCLRTDDLTEVGKTAFHHTFFEMLGNFSFGDYFKKEAIAWAWEFLTKVVKLDKEKLWVSVYKDDDEAKNIWLNDIKIDPEKVVALGDKSNFWPSNAKKSGPNGPCGPCSEIFFDYGPKIGCKRTDCDPGCDCGRFSEIWNLVFTQFNRKEDGSLEPLPNKNIDTGMGLERLAAVIQGKTTNFNIDLFEPIFEAIDEHIQLKETTVERKEKYILADHIRAIVFGICDGVVPSNSERGYIMKKLIITASDISIRSGSGSMRTPSIYKLVPAVIEAMCDAYPELKQKQNIISNYIKITETNYIKLREEKIPELEEKILDLFRKYSKDQKNSELKKRIGKLFFSYRDTHGLTIETMRPIAWNTFEEWDEIDWEEILKYYEESMNEQREKSRASSKMTGDVFTGSDIEISAPKTEFLGYEKDECKSKILQIFIGNESVSETKEGDTVKIILDKTPFYAESGGQIGDAGIIKNNDNVCNITQMQKISDVFIHIGVVKSGSLKIKDSVTAKIDNERRLSIMRNHTATHLLQAALRKVLGDHVQQQGSLVDDDRLRFDFTHPKAVSDKEIMEIERIINENVLQCAPVSKKEMSLSDAQKKGALAFFAEKYSKKVRVVNIGNISKELCGGAHLENTGQIGLFKILSESAIAQGIRRIEATTGLTALEIVHQNEQTLKAAAALIKAPVSELVERLNLQSKKIKRLEKEIAEAQVEKIKTNIDHIIKNAEIFDGVKVISSVFSNVDMATLRRVIDMIKQKTKSGIIALGSKEDKNTSIIISVSDDLIEKNIKANDLIEKMASDIGGSGGGRPQLAQAGSKENIQIEKALSRIKDYIKGINT
ncbi:MAG: alanine--tRNA ligase [Candidatus Aceula lacicola]|nr:alanine--tRNA ligase [Candidatus Aceula lacicola]